ncbi:ABC transporter permease [Thomasclavelia cocleata]|uniref:Spermidine/putrescine transport system permease protein n=1 Tax=Thomasclavelia cocleata TaxID=69824 RepID=A0A1I0I172_9FIRM|nr:ABC transporter permease [Thomasclavelia cocleata]MCR1961967.1 ABC transporter permease [Thomasclavelia cocleata]NDO42036.1 ABC transporter permease [Thomasclavelia cocleata]PJN80935.1 ABC transporter permease [Thomasclavelia cocleata]SET90358.1 spermidine/putrescine transport system permease protein [Thomasclavelia cocleata]
MKHFRKLVGPYCFWLFVLTVLPMFLIMIYAFIQKGNAITTFSFTLDNFSKFFDPIFVSVLIKSFVLGIITTILCLAIGYPVAYAISKCKEKTQTLLILLITFPTWINMLMRTYAWINILSSKGIVSNMFQFLGFGEISLLYTDFAVILGMVYDFLPFMILPIHTSLTKMDKSLVEASNDLGANPVTTFWKITFRLSLGGVLTGITMVFLPAISSFVIPKLLGGGQYSLIGNFIEQQFINVGDWHFGSAVSLILAILVIIFMGLINRVEKYAGYQEESKREKTKKL